MNRNLNEKIEFNLAQEAGFKTMKRFARRDNPGTEIHKFRRNHVEHLDKQAMVSNPPSLYLLKNAFADFPRMLNEPSIVPFTAAAIWEATCATSLKGGRSCGCGCLMVADIFQFNF